MNKDQSDEKILQELKDIKNFYIDLIFFAAVVVIATFVWAASSDRYFWPIWIILGWGAAIVVKAINVNLHLTLARYIPFFDPLWEEKELARMNRLMDAPRSVDQPHDKDRTGNSQSIEPASNKQRNLQKKKLPTQSKK